MTGYIRKHLSLKIFLSYLVVIIVGVIVLAITAEAAVPSAFARHLAQMRMMMSHMMGGFPSSLEADFYISFRAAVTDALSLAAIAAALIALIASIFISRQVVAPVKQMTAASRRIAEGHYEERVQIPGDVSTNELDELGQLALSFNQMADRLEKTETMRRELIGDVTHELRTPLTTIKGYMEGLMDGVLPAEGETYQQIYREADRLQRLVNDLQELSRVEAGAYELHRHPVAVQELMEAAASKLRHQFSEKGVQLEMEVAPDLPPVLADEDRIVQVLLNLTGNALQYTPSGGQVWMRSKQRDGEVEVSIRDTGIGIPAEHLPHIFTRFYRVEKSRSRAGGGSGIGLTIARHLVTAHGGRIWVESLGAGKGSTFTFTLPVA
jgi:histidine kinase